MKKIIFKAVLLSSIITSGFSYTKSDLKFMDTIIKQFKKAGGGLNPAFKKLPKVSKYYVAQYYMRLDLEQQKNLYFVYNYGKQYNLQNSLTAIAWKESLAGKVKINLWDGKYGSCGMFHNNLESTIKKLHKYEHISINRYNINKLCTKLMTDDKYSAKEAIHVLNLFNRQCKGNWKCTWAHYNGGNKYPNYEYAKDIMYRVKSINYIFGGE